MRNAKKLLRNSTGQSAIKVAAIGNHFGFSR